MEKEYLDITFLPENGFERKKCPECGKKMKYKGYIGDGAGPAPDHSYYECSNCSYNETILEENK